MNGETAARLSCTRPRHRATSSLIVCNVCHRPVERAAKLYGMELVNRGIFQQWRHNGEVVIKIECHGERYAVSNQLGPVDFDYMPSGPGR